MDEALVVEKSPIRASGQSKLHLRYAMEKKKKKTTKYDAPLKPFNNKHGLTSLFGDWK